MRPPSLSICVIVLGMGRVAPDPSLLAGVEEMRKSGRVVTMVVVENCSIPSDRPDAHCGSDVLICNPRNLGYAAAMNLATRTSPARGADALLFVTSDARPATGALSTLVTCLDDSSIGLAAPTIVTSDGRWYGGSWNERWGWARHRTSPPQLSPQIDVAWSDGACLCVRRTDFHDIGGFDEGTFLYGEDVQLCRRLVHSGRRVVVRSDAEVHQRSGSYSRPGAHGYLLIRNEIRVLRATGPRGAAWCGALTGAARAGFELLRASRMGPQRMHHAQQTIGMMWGVAHGLLGKGGPPPARLRKWGDIDV